MKTDYWTLEQFLSPSNTPIRPTALVLCAYQVFRFTELNDPIVMAFSQGCRSFLTVGQYSEEAHDTIDDVILGISGDEEFMTSFHGNESSNEVVAFLSGWFFGKALPNESTLLVVGANEDFKNDFSNSLAVSGL